MYPVMYGLEAGKDLVSEVLCCAQVEAPTARHGRLRRQVRGLTLLEMGSQSCAYLGKGAMLIAVFRGADGAKHCRNLFHLAVPAPGFGRRHGELVIGGAIIFASRASLH